MQARTAGIDARIETESGTRVAEVGDPHNRMNRLLSLSVLDSTRCLHFVDQYGDTVFNRFQSGASKRMLRTSVGANGIELVGTQARLS